MAKESDKAYGNILASLQRAHEANMKLLDTQLLALSAGTLGLSLTFISDLVVLSSAVYLSVLILAWLLLTGSIIAVLTGLRFATSGKTVKESKDYAKQAAGRGDYEKAGPDPAAAQIRMDKKSGRVELYSFLSYWSFIFGLVALMFFISLNLLYADECNMGNASGTATKYICPDAST